MQQVELAIRNATGLHARPARVFVNTAKQFQSDIRVHHGEKKANAKSLISMLTLGVEQGSDIRIVVDGNDEEEALIALKTAVIEGLGEEPESPEAPHEGPSPDEPVPERAEEPARGDTDTIRGIAAAPGIAIGPVFQLKPIEVEVEETFTDASEEEDRLQVAIEQAQAQVVALRQRMQQRQANSEADIFDVHLEIMNDPDLLETVLTKIHDERKSAAQAWQSTIDARAAALSEVDDPLLAARAADVHDVGYRVLRLLVGLDDQEDRLPPYPVIVAAHDLTPSDTASLPKDRVLGFCTAVGGPTAHSAIIARALSLPAVVSAGPRVLEMANDSTVILDGDSGTVTLDPDDATLVDARRRQEEWQERLAAAEAAAARPAVTQDGHHVEVVANVGGVEEAEQAREAGAEGVGLLRTEFLFLDRSDGPGEEEQFRVYRDIVLALNDQPVIVRTLDVGGDKPLPYINVPAEDNPFLGERGIRLCLNRPELLQQQVRAILRAAEHGPIRIMFPMVADINELRTAKAIVEDVRGDLDAPRVDIGIMVEVPAAALMADALATEVDFFSIGTNDLTQYTLAIDRQHPVLAGQSDGLHPAVLRLIARTAEAAHDAGKWVGVCGELGADPQAVPVLVGLGVDELSVSVPAVATVKAQIRSLSLEQAQELAQKALTCTTAAEVRQLVG